MKNWSFQAIAMALLFTPPVSAQEPAAQAGDDALAAVLEILEDANGEADKKEAEPTARSETKLDPSIEDVFNRGCGDDNGVDRCDPEVQSKVRDLYGIDSIEELAESRASVLRTMLVDGYGNDVAAISFVRERGKSPYVDVRTPSLAPPDEQSLRANISDVIWQRVERMSENFDKKLAHEVKDNGNAMVMCLHGWVTVAEKATQYSPHISSRSAVVDGELKTVSREIARSEPSVRSDTESACANGLAMPFSFALADEALRALPECSNLDLDDFRNTAMLLATCHRLKGDRLTASRAYSVVRELELYQRRTDKKDISDLFVSMDENEAERFIADLEGQYVFFGSPHATTMTDATVEAPLFYFSDEQPNRPTEQATLTIQLYEYASRFRIFTWSKSAKQPFKLPDQ